MQKCPGIDYFTSDFVKNLDTFIRMAMISVSNIDEIPILKCI